MRLRLALLVLLCAAPVHADPITFAFNVTGTATRYSGDASAPTITSAPLSTSFDFVFDPWTNMENGNGDDGTRRVVWFWVGHPEVAFDFGLPLPTDGDFAPGDSVTPSLTWEHSFDHQALRLGRLIGEGETPTSETLVSLTLQHDQRPQNGYVGDYALTLTSRGFDPRPDMLVGPEWLIEVFGANPLAFTLTSNEIVNGQYLAGSGIYEGTAHLVSVPEPGTAVLLLVGLLGHGYFFRGRSGRRQ